MPRRPRAIDPSLILKLLDPAIASCRSDLQALERTRVILTRLAGAPAAPAPVQTGKVLRIAAGSLEDRILSACLEGPATMKAIAKDANARKPDIREAVKRLVDAGKLKALSGGRHRTYALPGYEAAS